MIEMLKIEANNMKASLVKRDACFKDMYASQIILLHPSEVSEAKLSTHMCIITPLTMQGLTTKVFEAALDR